MLRHYHSIRFARVAEVVCIVVTVCIVISVPVYHGVDRYYLANPERGFDYSFLALLILNGKEMYPLPTTSFIHILIYSWAIWVADLLGFLETTDLDTIVYSNTFEQLYTPIIAIGRSLSILFSVLSTLAIWALTRAITNNWLAALLAMGLYASSLGLASQASQIGTELPTMTFILVGAWALVLAIKRPDFWAFPLIAMCGFFLFLALMTKLQAIFSILILGVLPLLLEGNKSIAQLDLESGICKKWLWSCILVGSPGVLWVASTAEIEGIFASQVLALAIILSAILLYVLKIGGSAKLALFLCFSLFLGISLAQYITFLEPHEWTTHSIANFEKALTRHVLDPEFEGGGVNRLSAFLGHLWGYLGAIMHPNMLKDYENPFLVIFWVTIAGGLCLFYLKKYQAGILTSYFWFFSVVLSAVYGTRVYIYDYVVLVEAWTAIGYATLFAAWYTSSKRKSLPVICAFALCLIISGLQMRYRHYSFHMANTQGDRDVCRTYPASIKEVSAHLPVDCGFATLRPFASFK